MLPEIIAIIQLLIFSSGLIVLADFVVCKLLTRRGYSFKKCFRRGLWTLCVPVVLIIYGMLIGRNTYQIKELTLSYSELPPAFDGYRIVQVSDIHSRSFRFRPESLQKAVTLINAQNADLILFTGDMITVSPDEMNASMPYLRQLAAKDGVMSIIGNADRGSTRNYGNNIEIRKITKYFAECYSRKKLRLTSIWPPVS